MNAVAVPRDNPGMINRRKGYPEEFRRRVRQAVREEKHKTKKQIAKEFGISEATILEWTSNKKWREAEARRDRLRDYVRALHWDGNTYHHIARTTGVPVSTVWEWINKDYKTI